MKCIRLNLDKLLSESGTTRYQLSKDTGINYPTIDKYYKNKVIRYDSYILLKICTSLNCGIEELIEIKEVDE